MMATSPATPTTTSFQYPKIKDKREAEEKEAQEQAEEEAQTAEAANVKAE